MTETQQAPADRGPGGPDVDRGQPDLVVERWLTAFDDALQSGDPGRAAELFDTDGYWRDFVAFTWNLRTLEGRDQIRDMLSDQLAAVVEIHEDPDEESGEPGEATGGAHGR